MKCPSKYQGIEGYESKSYSAGEGQASYDGNYEKSYEEGAAKSYASSDAVTSRTVTPAAAESETGDGAQAVATGDGG